MSREASRRTVIVGAGTGGATLAARLSEDPAHEVVLVEAGPDYPSADKIPSDLRTAQRLSLTDHDWGLSAYYVEPPELRGPQPYARGKVVGGSSAVNGSIAVRASVADHAEWVAAGNDLWSWDQTLPYFRRLENDLDFGAGEWHGQTGPVPVRRYREDELSPVAIAFGRACREHGFPGMVDMNAPDATGVGAVPRSLVGDERGSALVTYLPQARGRSNLHVRSETTCRRVVFEGRRAMGVELESGGRREVVTADEIVLAAGAIHTPQILTLSGIASAATLRDLDIPVVSDLPGVGRHLRDHVNVPTLALLSEETDRIGARNQLSFSSTRGGRSNDLLLVPTVYDPTGRGLAIPDGITSVFSLTTVLARPMSVGWIDVVSPDVNVAPAIHTNYLSDPDDLPRLEEGVRLAYEIMTTGPVSELVREVLVPTPAVVQDGLHDWMRASATTVWHASATCRMGPDTDPTAVVDQQLRVRGTEGLRIADASALPNVPTALTNLTVHMLAERLADWMTLRAREDHRVE